MGQTAKWADVEDEVLAAFQNMEETAERIEQIVYLAQWLRLVTGSLLEMFPRGVDQFQECLDSLKLVDSVSDVPEGLKEKITHLVLRIRFAISFLATLSSMSLEMQHLATNFGSEGSGTVH